jgi:hypothetical protein
MQSIALMMTLGPFKAAAGEGAAVELKLRLLAGAIPTLEKYAHAKDLEDVEEKVAEYFGAHLSSQEKDCLKLCRQLRNKVLHSDFRAARERLNKLGIATPSAGVKKVDISGPSPEELVEKMRRLTEGTEGERVSDTSSTAPGSVYGWLLEAGASGDFEKAVGAFEGAGEIIDRLLDIEQSSGKSKPQT